MNSCCYLLRRHFFKKISIHSHSNDKRHEIHDWDTLSSADKKLNAILEACRHSSSESKSTIAVNNCISNIEADWETLDDYETNMKRHAWRALLTLNGEKEPTSLTLALDVASQFNTNCILHEAIELGTDTHSLIQLANRFPILLSQIDGNGRYPLHVACTHGTSKEFVKLCIELNPSAVTTTDVEGNDPIHLLCKGTWKDGWDHHKDKQTAKTAMIVDHNMRSILWMLHNAGTPSSVIFEDEEGVGLIEHAIEAHLSELFIKELQDMIISFNEEKVRKKIANRNRCIEDTRQSKRSRLRQSSSSRPFI